MKRSAKTGICIAVMLILVLLLSAADADVTGWCGGNISWTLTPEGALSLTGTGPTDHWNSSDHPAPWKDLETDVTRVIIGEGITGIGSHAFSDMALLTDVSLPETLTAIGEAAFSGSSVRSVNLPDGITEIGPSAFKNCESLKAVVLPGGLTEISESAFYHCTGLSSVLLPDGLETIGASCFAYCEALETLDLPGSVSSIDISAFSYCSALEAIHTNASNASYCSVDGVLFRKDLSTLLRYPENRAGGTYTVPDSVSVIGAEAFSASIVEEVVLPDGLAEIQENAFNGAGCLRSVNLPGTLTTLGKAAFASCGELKNADLVIPGSVGTLESYLFAWSSVHSVVVQEGVTKIEGYAFALSGPENTTVTLPQSIRTLEAGALPQAVSIRCHHDTFAETWARSNGNPVAYSCDAALTIRPATASADGVIQTACSVCGYSEQPDVVLHHDRILSLPNSDVSIGGEAFSGTRPEQVVLQAGVLSVESAAFSNNEQLRLVVVCGADTQFSDTAFSGCPNLRMLCPAGSRAEQFAAEKGIPYALADELP